jgi:hypothetical protein
MMKIDYPESRIAHPVSKTTKAIRRLTDSFLNMFARYRLFLSQEFFHFVFVHDLLLESVGAGLWTANSLDHFCPVLSFS